MSVAVFNSAAFFARYSEFAAVNVPFLTALFAEAGLYLDNTDFSPVQDIPTRTTLLYMLTAHIAFIGGALSTSGNEARPVGRVSAASEGSVSASFEMNTPTPGTGAWYAQSQYGSAFWAATSSLRGMMYVPACQIW